MKELAIVTSGAKTMSSIEIAELTGKRHDNVTRDIKKILIEANIGLLKFEGTHKSSQGKELKCFNLPRRECDLVVSGYSVPYRLAIIDRWHELEVKQVSVLPSNFSDACRQLADKHDQLQFAIRTKAQISDKKTATAMQTAGAAVKRFKRVSEELGIEKRKSTFLSLELEKKNKIEDFFMIEHARYIPYKSKTSYKCECCGESIRGGIFGMVIRPEANGGDWGSHVHRNCFRTHVKSVATKRYKNGDESF